MKITRRFALTVLLCLGATLCATAPAQAQGFIHPLSCVVGVDDPDYGASGEYMFSGRPTLAWIDTYGNGYTAYVGKLYLSCSGLTPGAVYSVGDKKSHADRDGNLGIQWSHVTIVYHHISGWGGHWEFSPSPVYRLDTDNTSTLVLQ